MEIDKGQKLKKIAKRKDKKQKKTKLETEKNR